MACAAANAKVGDNSAVETVLVDFDDGPSTKRPLSKGQRPWSSSGLNDGRPYNAGIPDAHSHLQPTRINVGGITAQIDETQVVELERSNHAASDEGDDSKRVKFDVAQHEESGGAEGLCGLLAQHFVSAEQALARSHQRALNAAAAGADATLQGLRMENRRLRAQLGQPAAGEEHSALHATAALDALNAERKRSTAGKPPSSSALNCVEAQFFSRRETAPCLASNDQFFAPLEHNGRHSVLPMMPHSLAVVPQHESEAIRLVPTGSILGSEGDFGKQSQSAKFTVLPVWRSECTHVAATFGQRTLKKQNARGHLSWATTRQTMDLQEDNLTSRLQRGRLMLRSCIINPNSGSRVAWDFASLLLVSYDMAMIPFGLFDPPPSIILTFFAWVARIFWTIDMPMSFITGYVMRDGTVELQFKKIAVRYAKTWFILDIVVVGVDWMEVFEIGGDTSGVGSDAAKASRVFRVLRLVRLLRLVRMREVLKLLTEQIVSEKLIVVVDLLKQLCSIVAMSHLLACSWYGVGSMDNHPDSWIRHYRYTRLSLAYRYTTSLHWSLSQFAGGMDEVTPTNVSERVFTIVVFLLAFCIAAVFVSSITSSMTRLHLISSQQSQQISVLRRYFSQNKVSSQLSLRILRNAQQALAEQQQAMPEHSVELLLMVSDPLRVELHFEMYSTHLSVHPFFKVYVEECPQVMRKVCHSATEMSLLTSGDVIFHDGEISSKPKMYIVVSGSLHYVCGQGKETVIERGKWISEATLWTHWMHRGVLTVLNDCRLCLLDATKFQEISARFQHHGFDPKQYAAHFVDILNRDDVEALDLPFDLITTGYNFTETLREIINKNRGNNLISRSTTFASRASHFVNGSRSFNQEDNYSDS